VKTASRILGTAAFRTGYQVQDSPIFGAERRGAPVIAFTRIDREAIRERGVIDYPDLIVVADDSLIEERTAGVLAGQANATAIFVNCEPSSAANLASTYQIKPALLTDNISARTRRLIGRASALSAGLAAASARILGCIPREALDSAIREELTTLGVSSSTIEINLLLAGEVFDAVSPIPFSERRSKPRDDRVITVAPQDAVVGAPNIIAPGNAAQRLTGSWRLERPEIDYDVCSGCRLCYLACPEGAMTLNDSGKPVIDYDHCKGCMICWQLCPLHGITRRQEVDAW
jgi:pyruvate ferredoxin oxidoreductase gamma subunit